MSYILSLSMDSILEPDWAYFQQPSSLILDHVSGDQIFLHFHPDFFYILITLKSTFVGSLICIKHYLSGKIVDSKCGKYTAMIKVLYNICLQQNVCRELFVEKLAKQSLPKLETRTGSNLAISNFMVNFYLLVNCTEKRKRLRIAHFKNYTWVSPFLPLSWH